MDEQTQILTKYGWRSYRDLNTNDLVWAVHPTTRTLRLSPVRSIAIGRSQTTMAMVGVSHSSISTPDHRWLLRNGDVLQTAMLSNCDKFMGLRHTQPTGSLVGDSDAIYRLTGAVGRWGHVELDDNPRIVITVEHEYGAHVVDRLTQLIETAVWDDSLVHVVENGRYTRWVITGQLAYEVNEYLMPYPHTPISARDVLEGYLLDCPSITRGETVLHEDTAEYVMEHLQAMAAIAGIDTTITPIPTRRGYQYQLNLNPVQSGTVQIAPVIGEHTVWGPYVEEGFWVARRDRCVYITGNSTRMGYE